MLRGTLFFDVARICVEKKPKVIFCENIKGLTIYNKLHRTANLAPINLKTDKSICLSDSWKDWPEELRCNC